MLRRKRKPGNLKEFSSPRDKLSYINICLNYPFFQETGDHAVKCFEKLGYQVVRQHGSHMRMLHKSDKNKKPLTILRHKTLGKGLLRKLIRDADISIQDLIGLL